jgi:hypothetical protein
MLRQPTISDVKSGGGEQQSLKQPETEYRDGLLRRIINNA